MAIEMIEDKYFGMWNSGNRGQIKELLLFSLKFPNFMTG